MLKKVSVDASGKVELEDWVEAGKVTVQGSNANVSHTINEDEPTEFTNHNTVIENDSDVSSRHPIPTSTMQIFEECKDVLILCDSVPDTINIRVLNKPTAKKPLNAFQMTENNNIVITSVGRGWQIIRRGLLAQVDIKLHPELYCLCEDGETIDDLLRLMADQILLRWFNYHLKATGWNRRLNNFSRDAMDGENYTRTEQVLQNAAAIGCRRFLTVPSLVAGNPRLNLASVANLFNTHPGLEPLDEQEAKDYGAVEDFDVQGEREARMFILWLNSLGVEPGVFDLFENLKDGLIIL
ncbi:hypothetical protein MKEN_00753800 [Mycena kentingensis (nom. inval.)]|nr:hypothetical protein MKEN_00753800 [Mycena kentingensis (nom. inval.)]